MKQFMEFKHDSGKFSKIIKSYSLVSSDSKIILLQRKKAKFYTRNIKLKINDNMWQK